MIKLYGFGKCLGVPEPSPFVLKVMTFMKMCDIEYESISDAANLRKAPKGKLPFIEDDGNTIADSFFIIKYLKEKYNVNPDSHLSDEQRAVAHLITKSIDENLYWCIVYSRWMKEDTWPEIKKLFFGSFPLPLRIVIPIVARNGVKNSLIKHGMGNIVMKRSWK